METRADRASGFVDGGSRLRDEDQELLRRQARRQRDAHALLNRLGVVRRWEEFGTPVLCGAVSYGLMVALDIDVEIYGEPRVDVGFALVSAWAEDSAVRKVSFINDLDGPDGGLGWALHYCHGDAWWRVEVWLLPNDYDGPRSADLVVPMRLALDARARCAVLRIKEALVRDGTAYRSIDIYRAVLDHGIMNVTDYLSWCAVNESEGLLPWRPAPRRPGTGVVSMVTHEAFREPRGRSDPGWGVSPRRDAYARLRDDHPVRPWGFVVPAVSRPRRRSTRFRQARVPLPSVA